MNRRYKPRHRFIPDWKAHIKGIIATIGIVTALLAPGVANADAGIDTASYQGCFNGSQVSQSGASFAIVKITEGTNYTSPYATCQLNAASAAGMRRGAYHFARPESGNSPEAEADLFDSQSQSRGLIHAGVIPFLDWEPGGGQKTNVQWALRWLQRVESYWGTKPMIYMSASVINEANWSSVANAQYGLWVAGYPHGYTGDKPRNPGSVPYSVAPWPFAAAWQYSSSGHVAGIGSAVDVNWFYGDAGTWAKYANSAPVGSAPNPVTPSPTPKQGAPVGDAQTLATAVIRGDYGNDPQRRTALGNRYSEVMQVVNQRLGGNAAGPVGSVYVVKPGDYLSGIFGNDWQRIANLNGIRAPYVIYPGQRLNTGGSGGSTTGGTYRIKSGDTLSSIAARYGTSWQHLAQLNNIGNANYIIAGTTIRIS